MFDPFSGCRCIYGLVVLVLFLLLAVGVLFLAFLAQITH